MFKYLISAISNAIGFSKTETKGALGLILIILISVIFSQLYINRLKSSKGFVPDNHLEEWIVQVESSIERKQEVKDDGSNFDRSVYYPTKRFNSDKRIFVEKKTESDRKLAPKEIKDLNTATAEDLQQVKGIGPAFSERIVKYRNLLGGFAITDQISEVYGLNEETIAELLKQFTIQSKPEKLNINEDSVKVLARHPYISYDLARVIINYRKQNGNILSADDLKKIKAVDDSTFSRLEPYLN